MFSIANARDFLAKVQSDMDALAKDYANPSLAMNVILSAYHLHEWVWAYSLKPSRPVTVRGVALGSKDEWVAWLDKSCPHFSLLQQLTNGTKHCAPVHPTQKVEGFGQGPYGIGPFGMPYLLIDMGPTVTVATDRYLVGHSVLGQVVAFWTDLMKELP